jgi:hypothetical protein
MNPNFRSIFEQIVVEFSGQIPAQNTSFPYDQKDFHKNPAAIGQ